jgi:hypothetical protein
MQEQSQECAEAQSLVDEIEKVINEIIKLHHAELRAVKGGDYATGPSTEDRLKQAREQKALLIERYREHVISHGC